MNIVNWITHRIQNFGNRFAATFNNQYRVMYYGCIYKMQYSNYKHDPSPLILVLYSGIRYTHALNLNYLNTSEKQYIGRLLYALKKGNQVINSRILYLLLKRDVYTSIVKKSYRTYFSNRILQPRMVSAGFTQLTRLQFPFNDQFIIGLNKYLGNQHQTYTETKVAYYPQELQERIIASINSTPVGGRQSTISTQSAMTPTIVNIGR